MTELRAPLLEAECTDKLSRVEHLAARVVAGDVIQGPEKRRLAELWGIKPRSVTEYLYEAHRIAAVQVPREAWAEKLCELIDYACDSALEVQKPALRVAAITRVVEVAGKFTGSAAPERVQIEQVSIQVAAELTRYLQVLAVRLPEDSYRVCLQVAEEMGGGGSSAPALPGGAGHSS